MRGLTILVTTADPVRFRSGLMLALAHIALGGTARLFADMAAVPLLAGGPAQDDDHHVAAGVPTLATLLDDALSGGVSVLACQTGLALMELSADRFDPRIDFAGVTTVLAALGEDRLVAL